jgi:hypothetical protein
MTTPDTALYHHEQPSVCTGTSNTNTVFNCIRLLDRKQVKAVRSRSNQSNQSTKDKQGPLLSARSWLVRRRRSAVCPFPAVLPSAFVHLMCFSRFERPSPASTALLLYAPLHLSDRGPGPPAHPSRSIQRLIQCYDPPRPTSSGLAASSATSTVRRVRRPGPAWTLRAAPSSVHYAPARPLDSHLHPPRLASYSAPFSPPCADIT